MEEGLHICSFLNRGEGGWQNGSLTDMGRGVPVCVCIINGFLLGYKVSHWKAPFVQVGANGNVRKTLFTI